MLFIQSLCQKKRNLLPAFNQVEAMPAMNSSLQENQEQEEEEQNQQQQRQGYHLYQDHEYFLSNQDFQQQFDEDNEDERREYDIDNYDDLFNNHELPSEQYYYD